MFWNLSSGMHQSLTIDQNLLIMCSQVIATRAHDVISVTGLPIVRKRPTQAGRVFLRETVSGDLNPGQCKSSDKRNRHKTHLEEHYFAGKFIDC